MNSSRSFKLLLVIVALVVSAGVAGAVTISSQDTPSEAKVGARVTATYAFTDLYKNPQYAEWTLRGETELRSVTWTVQLIDQAGNVKAQRSYDGSPFNQSVSVDNDVDEVRVQLTGTVPEVGNWSYEDRQPFLFASFDLTRQGGTSTGIDSFTTARYTEESRQARQAIQGAEAAIEDAGGNQRARRTLDNAISAYEVGNFGNAVDLANQAEQTARSARQRGQTIQLVIYAIVAVIVIAAVAGAVFWYRSQQTQSKL